MLNTRVSWWIQTAIALAASLLMIRYQWHLLSYLEWGDESATIVTAKLIASGSTVFSNIHELHGPLAYLPGHVLEAFGSFGIHAHRIPIALLQWLALASIYYSPLLQSRTLKISYCLICGTIMAIYLPDLFGHTYIFQVIAGLFLLIILSQYSLPAILKPNSINRFRIVLGNVLILSLSFLAFTYIPISLCLFAASFIAKYKRVAIIAASIGLLSNFLYLIAFGSLKGYIALHFWINLAVSRQFIEGQTLGPHYILATILGGITNDLSKFMIFILISCALIRLGQNEKKIPWRSALIGIGIASLLVRSLGFQALPLLYTTLAMPLVLLTEIKSSRTPFFFIFPLVAVCLIKLTLLSPANIPDRKTPTTTPFSQLAQAITNPEDRIIAWPFKNEEYILANRLPASGNFFYLPWQGLYYENPLFGLKIDSCADINLNQPKIIFLEKYAFAGIQWGNYAPPCIDEILARSYQKIPMTSYYVRKDIYSIIPDNYLPH